MQIQTFFDLLLKFELEHGAVTINVGGEEVRRIASWQLFNLDETCLPTSAKVAQVWGVVGQLKSSGSASLPRQACGLWWWPRCQYSYQPQCAGGNANRETVTAVPIISADGLEYVPPLLIGKGEWDSKAPFRSPGWFHHEDVQGHVEKSSFSQSSCMKQPNAYMTNDHFVVWFKTKFLPMVQPLVQKAPIALLMDSFAAHITVQVRCH